MAWLSLILEFLLKPKETACHWSAKAIGFFFLLVGLILGLVFLFQFLSPLIGHLETGALYGGTFILTGILFIFLGRKKPTRPIDELMMRAQKLIRDSEADEMIRENAPKILLFSLAAGLILSQLKELRGQSRKE